MFARRLDNQAGLFKTITLDPLAVGSDVFGEGMLIGCTPLLMPT